MEDITSRKSRDKNRTIGAFGCSRKSTEEEKQHLFSLKYVSSTPLNQPFQVNAK